MRKEYPQAIDLPIYWYNRLYYWSRKISGIDLEDEVEAEYDEARIVFSYDEITRLTDEEFLFLQKRLQDIILASFSRKDEGVPEQVAFHIIPGTKQNVFVHERESTLILCQKTFL